MGFLFLFSHAGDSVRHDLPWTPPADGRTDNALSGVCTADRMLDLGFAPYIRSVLSHVSVFTTKCMHGGIVVCLFVCSFVRLLVFFSFFH